MRIERQYWATDAHGSSRYPDVVGGYGGSCTAKVRNDSGVVVTDTSVNSHLLDYRVPQELREPFFVAVSMSTQCKTRAQLAEGYGWHADPVGAINKLHY